MNSLLHRRRLHLSALKKSSGVLHRPRDPQAGAPGGRATQSGRRFVTKTYASAGLDKSKKRLPPCELADTFYKNLRIPQIFLIFKESLTRGSNSMGDFQGSLLEFQAF